MDITIIMPYDEGDVDVDCHISEGVRVFPGKLTLEQIDAATQCDGYPERAVLVSRDENGEIDCVTVTFSNDEGAVPTKASDHPDWYENHEGAEFTESFEDEYSIGHLSYKAYYSTMTEPVSKSESKAS